MIINSKVHPMEYFTSSRRISLNRGGTKMCERKVRDSRAQAVSLFVKKGVKLRTIVFAAKKESSFVVLIR